MNKGLRMVSQFLGNVSEQVNTKLKNWGSILFPKNKVLNGVAMKNAIRQSRVQRVTGMSASIMFGLLALAIIIPLYNVSGTEDTEAATEDCTNSGDSSLGTNCRITFTSTRDTATAEITPTANPVTTTDNFASSIPNTTDAAFSIGTNNAQGYDLKISSSAGTTLKPSATATLDESLTAITTSTGITKESTSFTNNTWGYLPSYYNSTANTDKYYPITTSTTTLRTTSSANPTNTYDDYTIGIGAKVDMSRTAGTYTLSGNTSNPGSITLSYVANPTGYEITYADNSGDSTVSNMPTAKQSGAVSATSIALAPNRTPTRTGYSLTGWCLGEVTSSGTTCSGTTIATNGSLALDRTATSNKAILYAIWTPNKYTCTKQYQLQNADGTWGSYITDTTEQVDYNSTCSYSKTVTNYKGSEAGANGSAAYTSAIMNSTEGITVRVSLWRNTYTCKIYAKYQNADGTYSIASNVVNDLLRYEQTCGWSRNADATYKAASYSSSISSNIDTTVNVDRNTYTLRVSAGINTSNATGGGTYRAGQIVQVSVNKTANTTCTTYNEPSWSQGGASGVIGSTSSSGNTYYMNYTMPTSDATVTAASSASNVAQTITLSRGTGASGITIAGTNYATSSVSLNCGTYNISGNYDSNYEFSSWGAANGVTVANTSSASTTMTVSGVGTLTLNASSCQTSVSGTMQTFKPCSSIANGTSGTLTDSRDNTSYKVAKLADGKWWMLDNLAIDLVAKKDILSSSNTNATDTELGYLKNGGGTTSDQYATSGVISWPSSSYSYSVPLVAVSGNISGGGTWNINTTVTSYGSGSGKVGGYYNYCAASAGTYCYGDGTSYGTSSGDATADICPYGWRMPTGRSSGEYGALYTAYSSDVTNFLTALSTPLSGYIYNGSAYNQSSLGHYCSSTRYGDSYMYILNVGSTFVRTHNSGDRKEGEPVRCVLK